MQHKEYRFTPIASEDVINIIKYFDEESDYKGDKFYDELIMEVEYVCQLPRSRRKYYKYFRAVFMSQFPFVIIYSFNKNIVYIHAVRSTKQNLIRVFSELKRRK